MTINDFSWLEQNRSFNASRSMYEEEESETLPFNCEIMWKDGKKYSETDLLILFTYPISMELMPCISAERELVGTLIMPNSVPFKYNGFDIRKCANPYCLIYKVQNALLVEMNHPITSESSFRFIKTLMSIQAKLVVVFEKFETEEMRYLSTSHLNIEVGLPMLDSPKFIQNVSAAALSHSEMRKQAAVCIGAPRLQQFDLQFLNSMIKMPLFGEKIQKEEPADNFLYV